VKRQKNFLFWYIKSNFYKVVLGKEMENPENEEKKGS